MRSPDDRRPVISLKPLKPLSLAKAIAKATKATQAMMGMGRERCLARQALVTFGHPVRTRLRCVGSPTLVERRPLGGLQVTGGGAG